MRRIVLVATLALVGCAGGPKPEAKVVVQKDNIPVIVRCPITLGPAPVYPDTRDALLAVLNDFERQKLLIEGRALRDQWIAAQAAQITICASPSP